MTDALYSGARMAVKLARSWEKDAGLYSDKEWQSKCLWEAKECRDRAAQYLRLRMPKPTIKDDHHVE